MAPQRVDAEQVLVERDDDGGSHAGAICIIRWMPPLSETEQRQELMFGCTLAALANAVDSPEIPTSAAMICMSFLSDAQELIAMAGDGPDANRRLARLEEARQLINRAKWVLVERVAQRDEKKEVTP
jgi:hypothetical protein